MEIASEAGHCYNESESVIGEPYFEVIQIYLASTSQEQPFVLGLRRKLVGELNIDLLNELVGSGIDEIMRKAMALSLLHQLNDHSIKPDPEDSTPDVVYVRASEKEIGFISGCLLYKIHSASQPDVKLTYTNDLRAINEPVIQSGGRLLPGVRELL